MLTTEIYTSFNKCDEIITTAKNYKCLKKILIDSPTVIKCYQILTDLIWTNVMLKNVILANKMLTNMMSTNGRLTKINKL